MIYTQRDTQIFSSSVYTVLFFLKKVTQYTLYTEKNLLHFRIIKLSWGGKTLDHSEVHSAAGGHPAENSLHLLSLWQQFFLLLLLAFLFSHTPMLNQQSYFTICITYDFTVMQSHNGSQICPAYLVCLLHRTVPVL